jgi:ubiquinone/menaquinone biosynthesis C-methylase UbiE
MTKRTPMTGSLRAQLLPAVDLASDSCGHVGCLLVLTEPDAHMAAKLRQRARALSLDTSVLEAPAERLPLDDASADTVVSTLVLCTVKDPSLALAEIARVLRPSGTLLFAEHVRSASPRAARWQDRLNTPWSWYACGCQ